MSRWPARPKSGTFILRAVTRRGQLPARMTLRRAPTPMYDQDTDCGAARYLWPSTLERDPTGRFSHRGGRRMADEEAATSRCEVAWCGDEHPHLEGRPPAAHGSWSMNGGDDDSGDCGMGSRTRPHGCSR
jgi:hypothetical protein